MNPIQSRDIPRSVVVTLVILYILSVAALNYGNYRGAAAEGMEGLALFGIMLANTLILSIPLGLLYFSIGVIIAAYRRKRSQGSLSLRLAKFIYWTPRIAAILIILFITLFSFDVFEEGGNILEMIGAFIMHSLPSIILAVMLFLAWRREWLGALIFGAAAIFFLGFLLRNPLEQFGIVLIFSGPMAVIAVLFWLNWKWREELNPA